MDPCWGNTFLLYSSKKLPCVPLGGLFELRAVEGSPFRGPQLVSCVASGATETQRQCASLGPEFNEHCQEQKSQTLIVRLLEIQLQFLFFQKLFPPYWPPLCECVCHTTFNDIVYDKKFKVKSLFITTG